MPTPTLHPLRLLPIPKTDFNTTQNNHRIKVYYPRVFSASSKQVGHFNTELISERLFEKGALRTAKKLAKNERFDAVYGHFFLYGGLAAIKIGRALNISSFVAFGECDYESQIQETYGDLKYKDIEGLSGVVSVSTKNARKLDELGIFKDIPVIVAPNAVDQTLFKKLDREMCRKQLGLPIDKFIVGFVGGFIERKGDKRLLSAVNQIDNVYLAYAGVGLEPPSGDRVLFCKALEHNDVPVLLNAVDVFCLPTLSEGSCNAVAEALACGVPVISSNLEFNDDVLSDKNSVRIDPNSVEQIKNAIVRLKNSKDDEPFTVNDRSTELELLYIDDLVEGMFDLLEGKEQHCEFDGVETVLNPSGRYCCVPVTHKVTLGEIVDLLQEFKQQPATLMMPKMPSGSFAKKLYSLYLSYLPPEKFKYALKMNVDDRGSFTELVHTEDCGQVSINISKPGITKGQHWHNSKWELFIVVQGHGLIQERNINTGETVEFEVSGDKIEAVHMIPGWTHNIINLSETENLVTVMTCNEIFNPQRPDTFFEKV